MITVVGNPIKLNDDPFLSCNPRFKKHCLKVKTKFILTFQKKLAVNTSFVAFVFK